MSLAAALELVPDGEAWRADAPETWRQGRTLYGGLTAGLCVRAASASLGELPPLRSAQFAFLGPAAGPLTLKAELLRKGRSSAFVAVDCRSEEGIAARAVLSYGLPRESKIEHLRLARPDAPPPEACGPLFEGPRGGFFQNFEMRLAAGDRIASGGTPEFAVWVRHLDDAGVDPVLSLLTMADSLPPAAMIAFIEPGPISTVTWSIDLGQPVPPGEWRLLRSRSEQAKDGYSLQAMELWSAEGARLAVGRQVVAVFV